MIRRYRVTEMFLLILTIILFGLSCFVVQGKMVGIYKKAAMQRSIINGVESINTASDIVIDNLSNTAKQCAIDEYEEFSKIGSNIGNYLMSEAEVESHYRKGYFNRLCDVMGANSAEICDYLQKQIDDTDLKNVSVKNENSTSLLYSEDENGLITKIFLRDVSFEYTDPIIGKRTEKLDYELGIPKTLFYTENEELFNYSMVARKGMYITGPTSSIIGNLYAGVHSREEMRNKETEYGEILNYGGINILSTQLSVMADKVVTDGDININGSFVVLSSDNKDVSCYARNMNIFDGFAKKTIYMLDGTFSKINALSEEEAISYSRSASKLSDSFRSLNDIPLYYDSNNDEDYRGPYRKIISNVDVELTEDFTGLVITPCNVIVGNDVNVEGLILSGDRIYVRGNNNIVSNRSILVKIIKNEIQREYEYEALDYLNGIDYRGITHPKYYAIPVGK